MPVAGLDIGSRAAKAVIMEGEQILSSHIGDTVLKGADVGMAVLNEALTRAGMKLADLESIMPTGYGRFQFTGGEKHISEISCHARGVHWFFPTVRTIMDIGGQDSKAIKCDGQGRLTNFVLNSKCAGGTGRFLEVIADMLEVPIDKLGELSLTAERDISFSTICVIFAKTEAIQMLREGVSKSDIIAGLHNSIAEVAVSLLAQVGVEKDFSLTGGVAKNAGVVAKISEKLGLEPLLAPEPQLIGAIGAALFASDRLRRRRAAATAGIN